MKKQIRDEARELRQNGVSVRSIAKQLGVSVGSVSLWVRDIVLSDQQVEKLKSNQIRYGAQNAGAQSNRRVHRESRQIYQDAGREKAKEMRPLHLAGCMLYWAEGAKTKHRMYFANSDSNMHLLFMRFLREEMLIDEDRLKIYIHCHTNDSNEIRGLEDYWLNLLGLSRSHLGKTYVKKGSEIQHSVLKYGVCGVNINSVELIQNIYGAIQEYGGFENPEWLF